jgi:hypothetical protein
MLLSWCHLRVYLLPNSSLPFSPIGLAPLFCAVFYRRGRPLSSPQTTPLLIGVQRGFVSWPGTRRQIRQITVRDTICPENLMGANPRTLLRRPTGLGGRSAKKLPCVWQHYETTACGALLIPPGHKNIEIEFEQ